MADAPASEAAEEPRRSAWVQLGFILAAYGALAVCVSLVGAAAEAGHQRETLLGGLATGVVMVVLGELMRRRRGKATFRRTTVRLAVASLQVAVGVLLLVAGGSDLTAFVGIASVSLGLAALISEWRYFTKWAPRRGPIALAAAFVLILAGVLATTTHSLGFVAGALVVGLLLAELGCEALTEDTIYPPPKRSQLVVAGGGLALLALAFVLMVVGGAPWQYSALISVVLVVLVAAVAADSDGWAAMLVVIVAVIWASTPRVGGSVDSLEPKSGDPYFVALGDSYISGEGAERYFGGTNRKGKDECRLAPTAYPVRLAQSAQASVPAELLFLACSGAHAVDLYGPRANRLKESPQLDQYRAKVEELALDPADLEFVLLSLGGNNAGFGEIGKTCAGPGDCTEIAQRWLDQLSTVRTELGKAYDQVGDTFGATPVYVAAYPLPLTPEHCWWSWLSGGEHRFLVGFVEQLNDVVEAEAREHGFTYMGATETAFVEPGLRICDPGDPGDLGVNFIALNPVSGDLSDMALPKHWIHNSFHPNEVGHERFAEIIGATITSGQPRPEHVARVTPVAGSSNQKPGEWTLHQIRNLVLKLLGVLSVGLFGAWLLLLPVFRWTRTNQLSLGRPQNLAKVAKRNVSSVADRLRSEQP